MIMLVAYNYKVSNMLIQKADEAVARLVVDINDKQRALDAITHLQVIYPDLIVERDPDIASGYMNTKFSSSKANRVAEDIDIIKRTTSGGETVEAWPYTTVDGYKVYSIPGPFTLGFTPHDMRLFGMTPELSWEDDMEQAGIALSAIRKARAYVRKNPPISY